jgi:hypothetical protein
VWYSDHGGFIYRAMRGKRYFDLTKFNTKPTALDLKITTAEELVVVIRS